MSLNIMLYIETNSRHIIAIFDRSLLIKLKIIKLKEKNNPDNFIMEEGIVRMYCTTYSQKISCFMIT